MSIIANTDFYWIFVLTKVFNSGVYHFGHFWEKNQEKGWQHFLTRAPETLAMPLVFKENEVEAVSRKVPASKISNYFAYYLKVYAKYIF